MCSTIETNLREMTKISGKGSNPMQRFSNKASATNGNIATLIRNQLLDVCPSCSCMLCSISNHSTVKTDRSCLLGSMSKLMAAETCSSHALCTISNNVAVRNSKSLGTLVCVRACMALAGCPMHAVPCCICQ